MVAGAEQPSLGTVGELTFPAMPLGAVRRPMAPEKKPSQASSLQASMKDKVLRSAKKVQSVRLKRKEPAERAHGDNPFVARCRPERTSHYPTTGLVARWCAVAAIALLVVIRFDSVLDALGVIAEILAPLLAGAAFAYVLNLVMERWESIWFPNVRRGLLAALRRPVCLMLSVASVAAVIAVVVMLVREELVDAIAALWRGILSASEVASETVQASGAPADSTLLGSLRELARSSSSWQRALESYIEESGGVGALATSLFGWGVKLVGGLVSFLISVVFGLYLLAGKEAAQAGFDRAARLVLPSHLCQIVSHVASVANECFSRFIFGQCAEACVLGSLCAIGMAILGMPYAATVGLVVGVGALIPYVGAWMAGAIGALIVFSVEPMQAVWFLVFLVALQEVDGHFVYPNVVGVATGVSSIWVLVAVFAGGSLFGLTGVLLSVPVVATCQCLLGEWADAREAELAEADAAESEAEAVVAGDGAQAGGSAEDGGSAQDAVAGDGGPTDGVSADERGAVSGVAASDAAADNADPATMS